MVGSGRGVVRRGWEWLEVMDGLEERRGSVENGEN